MARSGKEIFRHVMRIIICVLLVLVVILQGGLLNWFLVLYADSERNYNWLAWFVADIINCVMFIISLIVSYIMIHGKKENRHGHGFLCFKSLQGNAKTGELPFGYIAWGIYSVFLITRLAIFFKTGAAKITEDDLFGPNLMETAIGMTAVVFMFLVMLSSDTKADTERATYITHLIGVTTMDILDSVEFLDILFTLESKIILPFNVWNCILAFSCINLLLPFMPLLVLSHTRFGRAGGKHAVKIAYASLFIMLINVPFLGIRLYLWHVLDGDISVFVIKNIMMTMMGFYEIFELAEKLVESSEKSTHPVAEEGEKIEMETPSATTT